MKTPIKLTIFYFITLSITSYSFNNQGHNNSNTELKDTSSTYIDGTYQGHSQSYYTGEPYWGHIQITVENGSFAYLSFTIRDSSTHEPVDSMYGVNHYAGNSTYQQQCVNDGHGIEIYPQRLILSQDIDNVDAITGATWSYNIFIASAKNALKDAKIISSIDSKMETYKVCLEALPNPFTSTITLKYTLNKNSNIELNVFDSQGKLLSNLVDCNHAPGAYTIQWHDCPAPGIYIYRLKANDLVLCGKIIGIK
jgi:major membrane immunogen (membrane-anchored lipoprotein)